MFFIEVREIVDFFLTEYGLFFSLKLLRFDSYLINNRVRKPRWVNMGCFL
jgi:hypothetical protein